MNHKILFYILLVMLMGCNKNDNLAEDKLPDGKYPLILSVKGENLATTRAVDGKDAWAENDRVAVKTGTANEGIYYVSDASNGTLTPTNGSETYWTTTTETKKIVAWYPTDAISDISNQSGGCVAFDFLKAELADYSFNKQMAGKTSLEFKHQMAKVKVILSNINGEVDENINKATVEIMGYTTVNRSNGNVNGSDSNWIKTYKNGNNTAIALLPSVNHSKGNAFIKIKSGNNTLYYTPETQISLVAGKLYTFNIKIIDNAKLVIVSSTIDNFQPNQDSLPVVIKVPPKTGAFYLKNHTFKDIDAPTRQDYQDVIGIVVRSKYKSITILQLGNVNAGVMTFSTYYYKSYCLQNDGFDLATPDNLNELHQYMKTDVGMNKTLYAAYNITGIRNNLSEALLNFGNARFLPGDNNKETFFWTKGSKPGNDVWGAYLDGATSEIKTCVLANSHTSTLPGIYFKVINY